MKQITFVILITILFVLPCFNQTDADREIARTQEFIAATTKKGAEKISALQAYIKKFPDTSQKWTKLAYYQLTLGYFETSNYAEAAKHADITIKMGAPGEGEEGRLYLILANSYGIKSAAIFNLDKAKEYADKAVDFAKAKNLKDVLAEAQKLKKSFAGTSAKPLTPEQKMKMHYSNDEYSEAIAYYKTLGPADKANEEIHKIYANSLIKANQFDTALTEFKGLYDKNKTGATASKLGEIYVEKAKRNKAFFDQAVDFYLEAHLLYKKEGNASNSKAAFGKAKYYLFEKYGFNDRIKKVQAEMNKNLSSASQNEALIRKKKRELSLLERKVRKEYSDFEPPQYLKDQIEKLKKEIVSLEQGGSVQTNTAADELEAEKKKIETELDTLLARAKTRLGL